MEPTLRTKRGTTRTNEEMELMEYRDPEFTDHVRDFMQRRSARCRRCNGFLMCDGEFLIACRCVQCGDVIDPTILKNRTAMLPLRRTRYVKFGRRSRYPLQVV